MKKITLILFAAALYACNPAAKPSSTQNTSSEVKEDVTITNTYWKLYELNGTAIATDSNMRANPHIILRAGDTRFNGNTGCNSMSGTYELKDPLGIKLSNIISTKMACMNTMQLESDFLRVLEQADNYVITGDTLVLNKARMAPLGRFKRELMK